MQRFWKQRNNFCNQFVNIQTKETGHTTVMMVVVIFTRFAMIADYTQRVKKVRWPFQIVNFARYRVGGGLMYNDTCRYWLYPFEIGFHNDASQ